MGRESTWPTTPDLPPARSSHTLRASAQPTAAAIGVQAALDAKSDRGVADRLVTRTHAGRRAGRRAHAEHGAAALADRRTVAVGDAFHATALGRMAQHGFGPGAGRRAGTAGAWTV